MCLEGLQVTDQNAKKCTKLKLHFFDICQLKAHATSADTAIATAVERFDAEMHSILTAVQFFQSASTEKIFNMGKLSPKCN